MMCNADVVLALEAIAQAAVGAKQNDSLIEQRKTELATEHGKWICTLNRLEDAMTAGGRATVPNVLGILRRSIERQTPSRSLQRTLVLNEGITNYPLVWEHMRAEVAGGQLTAGGASLGWGLAAAVEAHMGGKGHELIVSVVRDGSFMFGVLSSAYWIVRKYDTVRKAPHLRVQCN
ncbi:hypothetical protein B0H10DRAFT_906113 [Mycena sp. CBHHK59/15]|nr:hypothetical protein B0H10DRAFT_906113 [Mycena sp. CBHHK59/15]